MTTAPTHMTPIPVSVIVPVYNGERYLAEALSSILGQSLPPAEIIVIDDGSTDRTAEIAAASSPAITCIRQENAGAAAARNRGIETANGDFFAFLDHDDIWETNKLELQWAALQEDPDLDVVFGHVLQFYCPSLSPDERAALPLPNRPLPAYLSGSRLVKRDAHFRAGPYDPSIRMGECLEWHARAIDSGLTMRMLPEVVFRRRIHGNNMGRTQKENRGDYALVMKRLIERRRGKKS
ncbi:MAG: glycosyltransferase family 2 protein [Desulfuromonas sp.]|mgnify:CR=1 FL=1|nr:MAG: glycosyltransferase family 2 protein [Desulfuromonas sp.]